MSLAQLVEHCIIYAGDRSSNFGHPTYPPYGWNFKPLGYMTKKRFLVNLLVCIKQYFEILMLHFFIS
jgi:hypothetical protein